MPNTDKLTFELALPNGPNSAVVIIAGGADADQDGTIDNGEVASLVSSGNVWSRDQDVQLPTTGMMFAISFTVGSGVDWKLVIKNAAGTVLYSDNGTTVFAHETLGGVLS